MMWRSERKLQYAQGYCATLDLPVHGMNGYVAFHSEKKLSFIAI